MMTTGAAIENYIIELKEVAEKWRVYKTTTITELRHTVTGLREGAQYEFRVTAENKAGRGPPSDPSLPAKYGECMGHNVSPNIALRYGYLASVT